MFDTIRTPDLHCVMCGSSHTDLQTKDGDCMLEDYQIGDKFPLPRNKKFITAYTFCTHQWVNSPRRDPFEEIGIAHWIAVHGIWIEAEIPVADDGEILPMITWKLTYRKIRTNSGVLWTDIKPGQYSARRMSAVVGDRIRKYYGTVNDGLSWQELPEEDRK